MPTHEGGSCLYWEFATDNYDIGFGVYFEWGKSAISEVQVQCDSEDEDDLDGDEEDDGEYTVGNIEKMVNFHYDSHCLSSSMLTNNTSFHML